MGLPYDLDDQVEAIEQRILNGCALTGLPFDLTRQEGNKPLGPSIDRVKPRLGYVAGNVRVICRAMNQFIGEWGEDAVADIAQAFIDRRT